MTATYYIHKGCGGEVFWDLGGGYCIVCDAEGLDVEDAEREDDPSDTPEPASPLGAEPAGPEIDGQLPLPGTETQ